MTPALHDAITSALAAGEFHKSIAKRLGISAATVSRVRNGQPRIDGRVTNGQHMRSARLLQPRTPRKPKPPLQKPSRGRGGSVHQFETYDDKASAGTFRVVSADGKVLGSSTKEWEAEQLARGLGARVVRRGES